VVYDPAKFRDGTTIHLAERATLDEFFRTYDGHHRLEANQLESGGKVAIVRASYMYHGGDMLYELEGLPGLWHEQLLGPAQSPTSN
jgi:hypothetical protein